MTRARTKKSPKKNLRNLPQKAVEHKRAGAVTGGKGKTSAKLYEAACKGTHLPEVIIE